MRKRGIILPPFRPLYNDGSPSLTYFDPINVDALKKYLLYWDVMGYPSSALDDDLEKNNQPEVGILHSEGILIGSQEEIVVYNTSPDLPPVVKINKTWRLAAAFAPFLQAAFFLKHKNDPDIKWSLSDALLSPVKSLKLVDEKIQFNLGKDPITPAEFFETGIIAEILMANSLPIPAPGVPVEEILFLRNTRESELQALRCHMEELYLSVINSADQVTAFEHARDRVERSLIDLNRVMNESFATRILSGMTVEISITDLIFKAATGAAAANAVFGHSLPLTGLGALLGAASSCIDIKFNPSALKPKDIPGELKDYAYIYHAAKDLVVDLPDDSSDQPLSSPK